MKYTVHVYSVVRVKVAGIEAESQEQATEKAVEEVDFNSLFNIEPPAREPSVKCIEYAEEHVGFLVDEEGDAEHENSTMFDLADGKLRVSTGVKDSELLKKLVKTCVTMRKCCEEALSEEWDRGDDGFVAMKDDLDSVLDKVRKAGRVELVDEQEKEDQEPLLCEGAEL